MDLTSKTQNLDAAKNMFMELAGSGRLTPDLRTAVESGSVRYRDTVDYIKADVSNASGIVDLLKSTTDQAAGVSSFDKNRLPAQNARLVHKMSVTYGAAEGDLASVATDKALTADLLTADIIVNADGNEVFRMPVQNFHVAGSNVKPNERFLELDTPFLLPDNKEIKVRLETADGVSITKDGTKTSALKVEFGSVGTFARS